MARTRWLATASVACVAVLAPAAEAAPVGELTYTSCYTAAPSACGPGKSALPKMETLADVVVSPDGRSVYAAANSNAAVIHFNRDPATGELTRMGCVTESTGCGGGAADGRFGLGAPQGLAISPEGEAVFVAGGDKTLVVLDREPDGRLVYAGCVTGAASGCGGFGNNNNKVSLNGVNSVAATPDGRSVVATAPGHLTHLTRLSLDPLTFVSCFNQPATNGCTTAGTSLNNANDVAASPGNDAVFVASPGSNVLARFNRNTNTGAIAFNQSLTHPSLTKPITLEMAPASNDLYVASLDSAHTLSSWDVAANPNSFTFKECFSASPVCDGPGHNNIPAFQFPVPVHASADGRSVYTGSNSSQVIHRFERDPRTGLLTRRECYAATTGCGAGRDGLDVLGDLTAMDSSPDGRDLYVANRDEPPGLMHFRRAADEPPACAPAAAVTTTVDTPVSIPLACGDPNGDAFNVAFPGAPASGSVRPDGGSAVYTPAAGFRGGDSFTVQATDEFGKAGPAARVDLTVAPAAGPPGGGGVGGGADGVSPNIARLTMASALRAASRGNSIVGKAAAIGATVRYTVSEAGTTTFTVERKTTGRRSGRRCVRQTRRNRRARKCVRYVTVRGSFTHQGRAGANSFKFSGRLRNRKLQIASYRLVAVAADAAGNKSAARRRAFRIVRR